MTLHRASQSVVCRLRRPMQPDAHFFGQRLQLAVASALGQCGQRSRPSAQVPTLRERDQWCEFLLDDLPDSPPRAASPCVKACPFGAAALDRAPLDQANIDQFPMQPNVTERTLGARPQPIHIQEALVMLKDQLRLPPTTVQCQDRLRTQDLRRNGGQDHHEFGQEERLLLGRVFASLAALPTPSPRPLRRRSGQAVSVDIDRVSLARGRRKLRFDRAYLTRLAIAQGLSQIERSALAILDRDVMRVVADDRPPTAVNQVRHPFAVAVAAIGQRHITLLKIEVDQGLTGTDIRQINTAQLQVDQIHHQMRPPTDFGLSGRGNIRGVDHQNSNAGGQSGQRLALYQCGQERLQPPQAGFQPIMHGLIAQALDLRVDQDEIGCDLALALIESGKEHDDPKQFGHGFDFARARESFELAGQPLSFWRQVFHEFSKYGIWIKGWLLHKFLLLWRGCYHYVQNAILCYLISKSLRISWRTWLPVPYRRLQADAGKMPNNIVNAVMIDRPALLVIPAQWPLATVSPRARGQQTRERGCRKPCPPSLSRSTSEVPRSRSPWRPGRRQSEKWASSRVLSNKPAG